MKFIQTQSSQEQNKTKKENIYQHIHIKLLVQYCSVVRPPLGVIRTQSSSMSAEIPVWAAEGPGLQHTS